MDCTIKHESMGRLRVHLHQCTMSLAEADQVEYWIKNLAGVQQVKVYDRTADATIYYDGQKETRHQIIDCLSSFDYMTCLPVIPEHTGRAIQRQYEDKMFDHIAFRIMTRWLLPVPIRSAISLIKAVPFVIHGLRSLTKGKLDVHVLDATSVTFALLRQDFDTAGSVTFLLGIGDIMEEWTHRKSVDDLANAMSLHIDKVWRKEQDTDVLVPIMEIKPDDQIVVRTGQMIPLDGRVLSGDAMVNQASITGEPLSVHKAKGAIVFAGTVLDEGQLAAVILIEDPIKEEAKQTIQQLHAGGFEKIVMLTGDSQRTAKAVATHLGLDDFCAEVLPEDKASYIEHGKALGHTVIMVGYGINDTPALSEADVGIAITSGAPIAREVADITISEKNLRALVTLRQLCHALDVRNQQTYKFIMTFKSDIIPPR